MSYHSSGQCSQNAQRQAEDQVGRKFDVVSSLKQSQPFIAKSRKSGKTATQAGCQQ